MSYGNMAEERTQAELDQEYLRIRQQEEQQQIEYNNIQNKTDMNTGTYSAKVAQVVDVKPWGEGSRQTFYHNLVMDNGHKINIGKKKTLIVGDALNYEVTEVGQQEFNKCKAWNPEYNNNAPQSNYTPKKSSQSNNASFALSYAKDVYVAHGGESPDNSIKGASEYITGLADEFLTWLDSK